MRPFVFSFSSWLLVICTGTVGCGGSSGSSGGGGSGGTGAGGTTTSITTNTQTLTAGECRDSNDCLQMQGGYCATPGAAVCGGAGCGLQGCSLDSDCLNMNDPFVCEIEPCCGDKRCVHGCSKDADCGEGKACTPDFHCVPRPCDKEACPPNFDCGMGSVPSCMRRPCSLDASCDGVCVLGGCYSKAGTCEQPAP